MRTRFISGATVMMLAVATVACEALPRHPESAGPEVDILVAGDSFTAGNNATSDAPNDGYFESDKSADDPRAIESVRRAPTLIDRGCFRSHNSYGQQLYGLIQSSGAYINAACSGDTTDNIEGENEPPQLQGFSEAQRDEVDLVALTIGGNDLGFADIVKWCFVPAHRQGAFCEGAVNDADELLEPADGGVLSPLYFQMKGALLSLVRYDERSTQPSQVFDNAKIVVVGYPLIAEDDEYELETCSGCQPYRPVPDIREGLERLNEQQAALVDELDEQYPGRFAFLPLHDQDGGGIFDGHGLDGSEDLWLREPGTSAYPAEWMHPSTTGHMAIADHLVNLPLVQQVVDDAVRRDYPRMSLANVNGQWYALDASGTLWKVTPDFVQCQLPDRPYKLVSWRKPEQLFTAAINEAPYPDLPSQPGCDLSAPGEGDILRAHLGGVWDNQYWGITYGPGGEPQRVRFSESERVGCRLQRGTRVFDIQLSEMEALYEDVTGSAVVPGGENCWEGEIVTTDIYGRLWMGHSGLGSSGLTSNLVTNPWFDTCLRLRGIEIHNIDYWEDPSYSNIALDYSGWTDAQCIDGDPQPDPIPHP